MSTNYKTQYNFSQRIELNGPEYECNNHVTGVYLPQDQPKEKKGLLKMAVLSIGVLTFPSATLATSVTNHQTMSNPIAQVYEMIDQLEHEACLMHGDDSLEYFLHKTVHQSANVVLHDSDDFVDVNAYYKTEPLERHTVEAQFGEVKEGKPILFSDWYDELEDAFYEV